MKVLLMHPRERFDPEAPPAPNAGQLAQDLELETLFAAMADGDRFLHGVARAAILQSASIADTDVIAHRQAVLSDCLEHPEVIAQIYQLASEALAAERRQWWPGHVSPESLLSRSLTVLELFMETLRRLRAVADERSSSFASGGFRRFFATLTEQLPDDYFAEVDEQITRLARPSVLISAGLGPGNKGTDYTLRLSWQRPWHERLSPFHRRGLVFQVAERDEAGARAVSELRSRGVNEVANAVAQSVDHIHAFLRSLLVEVGFYIGAGNLRRHLSARGQPVCWPDATPRGRRRLSARGLADPCLALTLDRACVGNDLDGDEMSLLIITGANQGGKSTFLRAIGVAQLMMQAGIFVVAERFAADPRDGLFTHFKREEDSGMQRGKLDEELQRMSEIARELTPDGMLLSNESFASTNEREGAEISRQLLAALTESGVKVVFVTHLFDLGRRLSREPHPDTLFLRAARAVDGHRSFKIAEGEPLSTSYAEDTYVQVFGERLR